MAFCSITYLRKDWFRFPYNSADCHWTWGLGFKISFPVSSQDILYSANTVRHRAAIIDGATTLLCIPAKNKPIRVIQLIVKNGWFHSDVRKDTFCVSGSISQFQAPVAVQTDTTISSTVRDKHNVSKRTHPPSLPVLIPLPAGPKRHSQRLQHLIKVGQESHLPSFRGLTSTFWTLETEGQQQFPASSLEFMRMNSNSIKTTKLGGNILTQGPCST